jgi:hypothetical protein
MLFMCGFVLYVFTPLNLPRRTHISSHHHSIYLSRRCAAIKGLNCMMILATRSFLVFTAASDCHLKIAEETRNDAEILGCGEE